MYTHITTQNREKGGCNIYSFKNLYRAYLDCREYKRKTYHAAKFEIHFESELLKLERELQRHSYTIGRSICFVVEEPSLREVFAATFRDRVVHHVLYNLLEPVFEPMFIAQSYACRKDKGIHRSLHDLQKYLGKITANHRRQAFYLHLDIRGFFMSLKKDILFDLINKYVANPEILWLSKLIIFNNPTENFTSKGNRALFAKIPPHKSLFHVSKGQGLPIGNLTSQFFANVYLSELDQFVKHTLKIKYYLRYVDDFLLLASSKSELLEWRNKINIFLKERLKLELNPNKEILQTTDLGIDWLGYIVKPDDVLIRQRIVKTFKNKLFHFNNTLQKYSNSATDHGQLEFIFTKYQPPPELLQKMLATVNSYYGHFGHANTYKLRNHLWEKRFQRLKKYLEPKDINMRCFLIKKQFRKPRRTSEPGKKLMFHSQG